MKKFRNIYIEIINICNLSCSFCPKTTRSPQVMTSRGFAYILDRVIDYTDYIYLHVVGEPLMNVELAAILCYCDRKGAKVRLTTNGTLLSKMADLLAIHPSLKAVNISLSCLKDFDRPAAEKYLTEVFDSARYLSGKKIKTVLRAWTNIEYIPDIKQSILTEYNKEISLGLGIQRIADYLMFDIEKEFVWPINSANPASFDSKDSSANKTIGISKKCLGLRKQIAILVDGTVVPCCLDSEGRLALGNIFDTPLKQILSTEKAVQIANNFANSVAAHPFCQTCTFDKM